MGKDKYHSTIDVTSHPEELVIHETNRNQRKYADDVNTHTIETHIYRLRKKILNKFKDENFIINSKTGYSI